MPHIHEKIDFTVEVFIVHKDTVLLRMHDKVKKWLGPGGHIELHEDPSDEPEAGFAVQDNPLGFYLYETAPVQQPLGALVISCLERDGIGIAMNESIYGDRCEHGVIWVDDPGAHRMEAFDKYLFKFQIAPRTLVFETPTHWPLDRRISAHQKAFSCVLDALSSQNG